MRHRAAKNKYHVQDHELRQYSRYKPCKLDRISATCRAMAVDLVQVAPAMRILRLLQNDFVIALRAYRC